MNRQYQMSRIPDPAQAMVEYRLRELHEAAAKARLVRLARGNAGAPSLFTLLKKLGAGVARFVARGRGISKASPNAAPGITAEG